jgi:hypothetical protein
MNLLKVEKGLINTIRSTDTKPRTKPCQTYKVVVKACSGEKQSGKRERGWLLIRVIDHYEGTNALLNDVVQQIFVAEGALL